MLEIKIHPDIKNKIEQFQIKDNQLGFGKYMAPIMIKGIFENGKWSNFELMSYGPLSLDPCAKVLHYGQEIFEGMKAFRHPDESVYLFRPELNAKRFNFSARRMSMPEIPEDLFLKACGLMVSYCYDLTPKRLGESLYLRPFMIATEVGLGIKPANHFHFLIVASPSGAYFSAEAVKVYIEREQIRSAPGGTGAAKTGGNYATSLNAYAKTLKLKCDQTLWLDAIEHRYIEEMSGMNFFAVRDNKLITPILTDTILNGITRASIIDLAKTLQIEVIEEKMDINIFLNDIKTQKVTEAFVCGTASVITPIREFLDESENICFKDGAGEITHLLRNKLIDIQSGRQNAPSGWLKKIEKFIN